MCSSGGLVCSSRSCSMSRAFTLSVVGFAVHEVGCRDEL